MFALKVGDAFQSKVSVLQPSDGINPPYYVKMQASPQKYSDIATDRAREKLPIILLSVDTAVCILAGYTSVVSGNSVWGAVYGKQ